MGIRGDSHRHNDRCHFLHKLKVTLDPMAAKRPRASVTPESLAELLQKYATSRKWLSYSENPTAAVNKLAIHNHAAMLRDLQRELGTLSLTSSVAERAFKIIAETITGLKPEHFESWAKTMTKRLRIMLRHAAQAYVKRSSWALQVFDGQSEGYKQKNEEYEEEGNELDSEKDPDQAEEQRFENESRHDEHEPRPRRRRSKGGGAAKEDMKYIVGYSWEHKEAWRAAPTTSGKRATKERTRDLYCPSRSSTAPMVARWPDGYEATIPELLQHQFYKAEEVEQSVQMKKRGNKAEYNGLRKGANTPVSVCYRAERPGQEMFRIFDNKRTVTFVLISRFVDSGCADPKAAAKDLAIQLAKEYVESETLDKAALVKKRDERLPKKPTKEKRKRSRKDTHTPKFAKDEGEKEDEDEYDFGANDRGVAHCSVTEHDSADPSATEQASGGGPEPPPRMRFHDMCSHIPTGTMSDSEGYSPRTPT